MHAYPTAGKHRHAQSGAAAVEFAFVFPFLFLLMYGVVVYAYTFVLQESINFAVQEAAEAAVAVDPDAVNADALRDQRVRATAVAVLSWLPAAQKQRVLGANGELLQLEYCPQGGSGCPSDTDAIIVTLNFNMTTPDHLFPVIEMPLVGKVPPLPERLTARAVVRV